MNTYTISPITTFDEEEELYSTKIGLTNGLPLDYIAFGNTEQESREKAILLARVFAYFNNERYDFTVHHVI